MNKFIPREEAIIRFKEIQIECNANHEICDVCLESESFEKDTLVFCDLCNVLVH